MWHLICSDGYPLPENGAEPPISKGFGWLGHKAPKWWIARANPPYELTVIPAIYAGMTVFMDSSTLITAFNRLGQLMHGHRIFVAVVIPFDDFEVGVDMPIFIAFISA